MVVAGLLLATGIACDEPTPPEDPLYLTVRAEPTEVVAGDSVFIEITLVNRSTSTVTVTSPESCLIDFHVMDPDGEIVAQSGQGCFPKVWDHDILPGSSTTTYVWAVKKTQPAGDYSVRAVMYLYERASKFSEPVQVRVLENS